MPPVLRKACRLPSAYPHRLYSFRPQSYCAVPPPPHSTAKPPPPCPCFHTASPSPCGTPQSADLPRPEAPSSAAKPFWLSASAFFKFLLAAVIHTEVAQRIRIKKYAPSPSIRSTISRTSRCTSSALSYCPSLQHSAAREFRLLMKSRCSSLISSLRISTAFSQYSTAKFQ